MLSISLAILLIVGCLWTSISSSIVAYRRREPSLLILAASTLLMAICQAIPLANLLHGFGNQIELWLSVQIGLWLLAMTGMATFIIPFGGFPRLRAKGLSLKNILLLPIS